jgi:TonB family protein
LSSLLLAGVALAEDQGLRNQAVHLLDQARLASRMAGPTNIRTEVAFSATEKDRPLTSGTYTRTRSASGALRQDVVFGDFRASRIQQDASVADQGPWHDLPYPVRALMEFVPYGPLRFDPTDVIQSIEPGMIAGQHATCIHFVTVRGEDRNPGEVCVSPADSTILAWHDSRKSWQATRYTRVNGGLEPVEFSYREGDSFSLTASLTFTLLDADPAEALTAPSDWVHGTFCKTFQTPVPTSTPQPPAPGTSTLPVIDIEVHAHVTAQGSVTAASILKPVRPDLDAEALALVSTWHYQPGSCEGRLQDFPIDVIVHFQGR